MLVLSRKQGQSIRIDDEILVTVSEVRGGRVRLSIDAPRHVRILRKEVLERDFAAAAKPAEPNGADSTATVSPIVAGS
jgi:carbon storage regulator